MVFDFAAALYFIHSTIAARPALQHIDTNPDTGMLEGSFENRRDGTVGHQRGSCGVFPRIFLDDDSAGEKRMRHPADFEPNVLRRAGFRFVPSDGFADVKPQAAQALQPCRVARFRQVNSGGHETCFQTGGGGRAIRTPRSRKSLYNTSRLTFAAACARPGAAP